MITNTLTAKMDSVVDDSELLTESPEPEHENALVEETSTPYVTPLASYSAIGSTKCCCIFRLNTGGLILGWLGIIISVVLLFFSYSPFIWNCHTPRDHCREVITFIYCHMIASACLLNGCRDLNPFLMVPWFITESMMMIFNATSIYTMIDANLRYYDKDGVQYEPEMWETILFAANILITGFRTYWLLCMGVYFRSVYRMWCYRKHAEKHGFDRIGSHNEEMSVDLEDQQSDKLHLTKNMCQENNMFGHNCEKSNCPFSVVDI